MVTSPVRRQDIHRFTKRHLHKSANHGTLTGLSLTLPKTPLFGTDGIRGRVGELLTAELALQIGFWAGQILHSQASALGPVIVGQDSRNSSDMLAS
ncbi:MAG: phosphoglucosamine mutase, partial [Coleofasciculus sp. C2-GNP5-27]